MWEFLAVALWTVFVSYTTWFLTSAKYNSPISPNEAMLLWKIHRQDFNCNAKKWREIRHAGRIVGFRCECGYLHVQKRPIVARPPTLEGETSLGSEMGNSSMIEKKLRQ